MSDQACKSEEQHRIDTLQEMANTEHQLRMARTQYESAKWELVRASEALLEWQNQWSRERSAVFACYPDAMPVDSVVEDARATMDRFLAQRPSVLSPTPTPDFSAEKETAREQLEREPEIPEGIPVIPATEWTEPLSGLSPDLSSDDPDEQDDASEFISDLTGDPAIEPEAGLHEERPALNEAMQDEREQPVTDVAALIASGDHSYDEVAAIAYPEPDGYAPVTNPEADALAKAHDWYDPKAVHDRNRFNPWGIFKREDA